MNRTQKMIASISYILGMLIILREVFSDPFSYLMISLGAMFVIVAWIICLVDVAKQKPFNLLWFWFIFFMGGIAIPIYLTTAVKKVKTMPNNG